jgi:hypothetical protein
MVGRVVNNGSERMYIEPRCYPGISLEGLRKASKFLSSQLVSVLQDRTLGNQAEFVTLSIWNDYILKG